MDQIQQIQIDRVKKAMEEQGISAKELAEKTRLSPKTIAKFFKGDEPVNDATKYLIAKELKIDPGVLDLKEDLRASISAPVERQTPSGDAILIESWDKALIGKALSNAVSPVGLLEAIFGFGRECGISHIRLYEYAVSFLDNKLRRLVSVESAGYRADAASEMAHANEKMDPLIIAAQSINGQLLKAQSVKAQLLEDESASETVLQEKTQEIERLQEELGRVRTAIEQLQPEFDQSRKKAQDLLDAAERLRAGYVVQFENPGNTKIDPLRCFQDEKPIVFELDRDAREESRDVIDETGALRVKIRKDVCGELISEFKSKVWIEFPLMTGKRKVGKLSCDVPKGDEAERCMERFWPLVQMAASFFDDLFNREDIRISDEVDEITKTIDDCATTESLYACLTKDLPGKCFRCRFASLFVRSVDSLGYEKLILRKSSFTPIQEEEDKLEYHFKDPDIRGLTAWVARNKRSLRLQDLEDSTKLAAQVRGYNAKIEWSGKKPFDSRSHRSFLAVPILQNAAGGELVGVIRLTEVDEKEGVKYFTDRDQLVLERLARRAIGP
jgi:transcriptional regulator with XRE-family HTH domain